jgi:hypothetical protein
MPKTPKPADEPTTAELLDDATASTTESSGVAQSARAAVDATAASRDRYQGRIADVEGRTTEGADPADETADTTDMSAVGDDGQVFGG